jgi:hypothetical protein
MTSLVPVLTVAFAFLKGAGYGEERLQAIKSSAWLAQMPEQFQQFVEKLIEMVEGINVSALGTIGAAFFTLTAILLLANVGGEVSVRLDLTGVDLANVQVLRIDGENTLTLTGEGVADGKISLPAGGSAMIVFL